MIYYIYMENKPIIIRISTDARNRIKSNAAKKGISMIKYVDELSKIKLDLKRKLSTVEKE